jgi:hypothetical protein
MIPLVSGRCGLSALRDYLLPRLLSGRVRVREEETHIGRVA